jgi:hypothetical protein
MNGIDPQLYTHHICWVCVIFFARVVVSELGTQGGVGGRSLLCGGSGEGPPKFFFAPRRHISGTT